MKIEDLIVKCKLEGLIVSEEADALVSLWEIILQEVNDSDKAMKAAAYLDILLNNLNEDFG